MKLSPQFSFVVVLIIVTATLVGIGIAIYFSLFPTPAVPTPPVETPAVPTPPVETPAAGISSETSSPNMPSEIKHLAIPYLEVDIGGSLGLMQLIGPQGKVVGYNPETGNVMFYGDPFSREIRDNWASYTSDREGTYNITINNPPAGEYMLLIFPIATTTEKVTFGIDGADWNGESWDVHPEVELLTTSTLKYIINYSPEPGTKVEVKRMQ